MICFFFLYGQFCVWMDIDFVYEVDFNVWYDCEYMQECVVIFGFMYV